MPKVTDYGFSKMKTQISDMGYTLNRIDIDTSYNSAVDLPGVVENDVSAEDVDLGSSTPDNAIPSEKISELNVEKLETGTIYSRQITLGVTDGAGDSYIGIGAFNPVTWTATNGILMGIDDSDSDKVKFYMGNGTNWIDWNVTTANTLTVAGSLVAGEIHIPDVNTTANSFHVESDGSGWIGATSTNRAIAPIQWTAAGVWDVGNIAGTYIRINGPTGTIGTTNFSTGVAGWQINKDGSAEFENIKARGSLYGTTFKYDVVSAIGGQLLVTNADSLSTAMTALDASTMTILGNTTFAANDMLLIRAVTGSGIQEEYLRVTSAASAPTYSVTRDLAAAYTSNNNPAWGAGTAVVKIGVSDGAASYSGGWLRLLGQGTNSPHYSVFTRTGVAYNSYSEKVRLGNLNGIGQFSADTYGIFIGDYSTRQFLSFDTTTNKLLVNNIAVGTQGSFAGDGSDGAIDGSSDVTITGSNDTFIVKNYTSWAAGSRTLTITPTGCILLIKVQGDCDLTNWTLSFSGKGAQGAAGGAGTSTAPSNGSPGTNATDATLGYPIGAGDGGAGGLGAGTAARGGGGGASIDTDGSNDSSGNTLGGISSSPFSTVSQALQVLQTRIVGASTGGGGGGGGGKGGVGVGTSGAGGAGGNGGGCVIFQIGGNVTFSSTTLTFTGTNGANGSDGSGSTAFGGGGGGGGAGGLWICLYNGSITGSGTATVTGGSGGTGGAGTGGPSGDNGGAGGAGVSYVAKNTSFA